MSIREAMEDAQENTYQDWKAGIKMAEEEEILKDRNAETERPSMPPSYYQTAGIQPIEIMRALMTQEQFEGFLWGNIIKYAYRYGKKEDKEKTAAKIEQYAKWLKEILDEEDAE